MNAAWGGISDDTKLSMCLSAGHKTVKNILSRKGFTVSMADAAHVTACDYVGIVSANNVPDKLQRAGFHTVPSTFVDAPVIQELPMTLECRLIGYDPASCRLEGEIVNVSADECILGSDGEIDVAKLDPITFDPGTPCVSPFGRGSWKGVFRWKKTYGLSKDRAGYFMIRNVRTNNKIL